MLTVPVHLVRILLGRRTMIPAPWIYLAALALGAVLGIALDLWLGWPWWAVTIVVVAGVWLGFLSSAFTGPARGDGLGAELLNAIDPRGAMERRWDRVARLIRTMPFPIYGLDASWTGTRMLGGHGMRGGKLSSVDLIHGDANDGPWVRVETAFDQLRRGTRVEVRAHLQHRVRRPVGTEWAQGSIPVEGQPISFDLLDVKTDWAALGVVGDLVVAIQAHQMLRESVRLAPIPDVEPYIEGWRRSLDEERRTPGA